MYYIIYLLSGLIVGYRNSPYSLKLIEIAKNLFTVFAVTLFLEYIRSKVLEKYHSLPIIVLITIVYVFIAIEWKTIRELVTIEEITEFLLGNLLPTIVRSILLTYLSLTGGYLLNFSYIIPVSLITILLPIFPDVNWFINSVLEYVSFLFIFLFVNYENLNKYSKRKIKKQNPIWSIPIIIFIIFIALFVAGFFQYSPVAIISNSMIPVFSRGSVCVIKKIKDHEEIKEIKTGDIIEYNLNGTSIVHRVEKVKKTENEYIYTTKGDNNKNVDLLEVKEEQVNGIVRYTLPYLGYPSVWFSEFLLKFK